MVVQIVKFLNGRRLKEPQFSGGVPLVGRAPDFKKSDQSYGFKLKVDYGADIALTL